MPNNLTDDEINRLLDLSLLNTDKLALVQATGDESTPGTEVAGGSYARQALTFAAAASRAKSNSAIVNFSSLPTIDVQGWEIWNSGGTARKWWGLFNPTLDATSQDIGDTITSAGHGRSNGDKIVFPSSFTPTGLVSGTTYFVISATTDTFQVSLTLGGSPEDVGDGTNLVFGDVLTESAGDSVSVAIGELSLLFTA